MMGSKIDALHQKLMDKLTLTGKQYDLDKIERAYYLAQKAHDGQLRRSGEPYFLHPVEVAIILADMGMDSDSIAAGLLHDVVEDTNIPLEEIRRDFGSDIALLVDGVTKLGRIPYSSRERQQAENVRKMLLATAKDVRVIIIKLADRLHNARTFQYLPDEKRRAKALETMEIYAPLAHRLGISGVKEELEDISIRYLDPIAYHEIEEQLTIRKEERKAFIQRIIDRTQVRLRKEKIKAQMYGRVKSIYGIYRKVYVAGRNMDEIYDIYAVRVIVDTVAECYNVLGVVHDLFRPIPNRFKDYISTPKQNMYQSLHTTVIDPNEEGVPFEVQIRTWDMHYTAEYGVAAHWKYKIGQASGGKDSMDERLAWIRQLLESQKESDDVEDLVKSIKTDIAPEEVFVFTPKGDVIRLPADSTVIDFAYAIHTQVGNQMIGAKADGRMVSLDFKVKTGMIVEIITAKGSGPSRDWLNIVHTSEAKNKIRSWFKKERREENITEGKASLEREFRRNLISFPSEEEQAQYLADFAVRQKFNSLDDFYAALGYGGLPVSKVLPRIKDDFIRLYRTNTEVTPENIATATPSQQKKTGKNSNGVIVEGLEGCLVKFAHCCNPVPGDDIIGFITRGFGVSIHKKDCDKARNTEKEKERWVRCWWASEVRETFKSCLVVRSMNRPGLLADVSVCLSNMHIPIHTVVARELKDQSSQIQITLSISSLEQLQNVIAALKRISGVNQVERTTE